MKMAIILNFVIAALTLCSCSENDGPDAPGLPPASVEVSDSDISASFVGKYFRLPYGQRLNDFSNTEWCDTVWQNERVYNQIILESKDTDINGLNIYVTDMVAPDGIIPAESIRLYKVGYVKGDAIPAVDSQPNPRTNAYVADALTEILPTELVAGEPEAIWISVDVPDDIPTGIYSGAVNIAKGDDMLAKCEMTFKVTSHRLPDSGDWSFFLDIWQFPYRLINIVNGNGGTIVPFSNAHFELLRPFYRLLADAGQKCITAYIKDGAFNPGETMIKWAKNADSSWTFDYTDFDNYVGFMMSLGIDRQISCFSLGGWNNSVGYSDMTQGGKYQTMSLKIGSPEFNEIWNIFLNDFRSHLLSKGWMDKTVLYMDENRNDDMRLIVKTIRSNGSDWKIGLSGRYIDADVEREFYNYSTIIGTTPSTTAISVPIFYTSCSQTHPNNFLTPENSVAEMTWMPWHAMALGFKGYQRWAFDNWFQSDPFDACDKLNTAGDFHMIYRSDNTVNSKPVLSIRWEMLRDGIQDYEKCRLLDYRDLRQIIPTFKNFENPDAEMLVKNAQSTIKKLSVR